MLLSTIATGNDALDNLLASIVQYLQSLPPFPLWNTRTGEIRNGVDDTLLGYIYRYLHVKFSDDLVGTNFGDTSTGRKYYGTFNSNDAIESVKHTDYTWVAHPSPAGFVAADKLYFKCLGGRVVDLRIGTVAPSGSWSVVSQTSTPIDLDSLIPLAGISSDAIADDSITTVKYINSSVTLQKIQDIAGGSVLGRVPGPAGAPTELTATTAGLLMLSAVNASAQRALLDFIGTVKTTVTHCIPLACSDEDTQLIAGTRIKFRIPYNFLLSKIKASLNTPQTSGSKLEIDFLLEGVSVFSTRITIDNTTTTSEIAGVPAVLSTITLPDDAVVEVVIIAAGVGCAGLKLYLLGRQL